MCVHNAVSVECSLRCERTHCLQSAVDRASARMAVGGANPSPRGRGGGRCQDWVARVAYLVQGASAAYPAARRQRAPGAPAPGGDHRQMSAGNIMDYLLTGVIRSLALACSRLRRLRVLGSGRGSYTHPGVSRREYHELPIGALERGRAKRGRWGTSPYRVVPLNPRGARVVTVAGATRRRGHRGLEDSEAPRTRANCTPV